MKARLNGEEVSIGHTKGMYWTFEQMIAYVSQDETLYPGDFLGWALQPLPSPEQIVAVADWKWGDSCEQATRLNWKSSESESSQIMW